MNIYSYICIMKSKATLVNPLNILRAAEILKTIGHPVRLEILDILGTHTELSVSDIIENMENSIEQSLLSHHLIKMKDKGILDSEKRGMHIFYSLRDKKILKIFDCMERCDLF